MPEPPRTRRLRVLLNAGGRVVERGPEEVRQEVEAAFAASGAIADVRLVRGNALRGEAEDARDAARAGDLDGVVVGGGDGSVGTVAGVLAGTGVAMGVLPLGTLNHFAKDLGMPLELADAVHAVARGVEHGVDVGEANGVVFVNNAVMGVYPFMVSDRERRRASHAVGKWLAMFLAFMRMLRRFPRRRLKLKLGSVEHRYRTPCLFVGVNEYHLDRLVLRRASGMDGGRLWFAVARHRRPLGFVAFAARTAWCGLDEEGDLDVHVARAAVVRPKASRAPIAIDGEAHMLHAPVRFTIRPRALQVITPPPA